MSWISERGECRDCGATKVDGACPECDVLVRAAEPRKGEWYAFPAEDYKVGRIVGAEQCDGCGADEYEITRAGLKCSSYSWAEDDEAPEDKSEACGHVYPWSEREARRCILP